MSRAALAFALASAVACNHDGAAPVGGPDAELADLAGRDVADAAAVLADAAPAGDGPFASCLGPQTLPADSLLRHSVELLTSQCTLAGNAVSIALDASYLYVAGDRRILRVPRSGGAPTVLYESPLAETYLEIALVGDELFARTDDAHLYALPVAGGSQSLVYAPADPIAGLWGLASDGEAAFVSEANLNTQSRAGTIRRFEAGTHARSDLAAGVSWPDRLTVDGTGVYVASWGTGILRIPKSGGSATVIAADPARLGQIALTTDEVFWIRRGGYPAETDGAIRKAPKGGGAPVDLTALTHANGAIAVWNGSAFAVADRANALPQQPGDPNTELRLIEVGVRGGQPLQVDRPGFTRSLAADQLLPASDGLYGAGDQQLYRLPPGP